LLGKKETSKKRFRTIFTPSLWKGSGEPDLLDTKHRRGEVDGREGVHGKKGGDLPRLQTAG